MLRRRARYQDVMLEDRLRRALARINPGLPAGALDDAARRLLRADSPAIEDNNRAFQQWLLEGVKVEVRQDGRTRGQHV